MVLKDIAEAAGIHESTVSRVTAQKYMACPRGVFELKYFFRRGWKAAAAMKPFRLRPCAGESGN